MHARIYSATTIGINAHEVNVEVDLSMGLINFFIVGLPDKAIKESKERIRAALKNSGLRPPERLITVNLAPAHIKKQNILFDVPIAIAILQAAKLINLSPEFIEETLFLGELALDGEIRPVLGILAIVDHARSLGRKRVIVPEQNTYEASLIRGIEIIGVNHLVQLVSMLRNEIIIAPTPCQFDTYQETIDQFPLDFSQVKGQWQAKRALQITAAGRHNILFIGPPGSGKTMLAQRLASILPPMSFQDVIETTKIYSVAGLLPQNKLIVHRPFRNPHHTISQAGLVGGGSQPRPGEISLAHNGVLFLDELTEFRRTTLEVLRQPLEAGKVFISRALSSLEFPASFILIAALNPCPCGFWGDTQKQCICSSNQITAYFGKISGPLLDRIDLHVTVSSIRYEELGLKKDTFTSSAEMKEQVDKAVAIQKTRSGTTPNAYLDNEQIEAFCQLTPAAERTLRLAFDKLGLSMRGYHKLLKIARTIADLEQSAIIDYPHIQEAISYRCLDKTMK